MKQEKTDIFALDGLRTLCILAVVLIHSVTRILERTGYDLHTYEIALFLDQVGRFAVPLFFLLSGFVLALHYHRHENFIHFFVKRINRIFLPYLFWSFIYYFLVYKNHSGTFLNSILTGNASYQLYFIPAILVLYLLFPVFYRFKNTLSNPYILVAMGGLQIYFLYYDYFVKHFSFFAPFNVVLMNFFFFTSGILAARHHQYLIDHIKKLLVVLVPATLLLPFYIFKEGESLYYKTYDIGKFYSSWRPDIFLYTFSFAAVFYYLFSAVSTKHQIFRKLSRLSFFVYFIHTLIIEIVWSIFGEKLLVFDKTGLVLFSFVTFASFALGVLVHKVRYLSRITG